MIRSLHSIRFKLTLATAVALSLAACGGGGDDGDSGGSYGGGGGSAGPAAGTVWVRLPGPSGDRTEIAVGGIKNEPANRVYMCEKRGSTAAGFYKGTLSTSGVVTWDAVHSLPNTYFTVTNGKLVFDYRINGSLPTDYLTGTWSGECGPLENLPPTKLAVVLPSGLTGITSVTLDGVSLPLIPLASTAPNPDCSVASTTYTLPRPTKRNTNGEYYSLKVSSRTQGIDNGGAYQTTVYETAFFTHYFKAGECNAYQVMWGSLGYTLAPR